MMTHAEFEALVLPREALSDSYIVNERRDVKRERYAAIDLPWPRTSEKEREWTDIRRN